MLYAKRNILPIALALSAVGWAATTAPADATKTTGLSHSITGHIIFQSFTTTATLSIASVATNSATTVEEDFPTRTLSGQDDSSMSLSATSTQDPMSSTALKDTKQAAECMAAGVEDWDRNLQIGGVFIILFVSALGAMLPVACKHVVWLNVSPRLITLGKFFGAGVILATAFVHMLGGATETLKDDCLDGRMGDFDNWPGLLAMFAVLAMHLIEHVLTATYIGGSDDDLTHMLSHNATTLAEPINGSDIDEEERKTDTNKKMTISGPPHGHIHTPMFMDMDRRRRHLSTYILELGIALHSVIVGMTLAVTGGTEFKTLLAAISFHQFFEGMALGTRISELQFMRRPLVLGLLNALVFALTTPLGQTIGIGIRQSFAPRSPSSLIVMGVLDSLSAGILMYSAIVNLLVEEFASPEFRTYSRKARIACFVAMYAGCAGMSIIGKWA
ncbi:hypothetical protein GGI01_001662 [Coemansia sp. RSA 376]|nr:hypothetical protein LPJ71_000431 [Coemansia sp. S17]KAJ2018624.1 hypothetical protein GGI14_002146 [Coemansia sp. S680]KAJ2070382.1 hypothetical protein GGH13_004066 [Coemansia sp. S155-1]KAJ2101309.1 hypothetical protein GGI09_001815 [Coemansia sp. S100]KAJ2102016.1 hypothetical protein GGI16_003306 [Coemansia sp. S142-1]KAJ2258698.1 hypothetical protein GGI13_000505 [Coemansia sp. RSA 455]KAJ2262266.1 hypothetical protein GGI01_001662 [Coemansia sp. RSA 376]